VSAFAPELDLLSFLLAVFTAVFPVGPAFFDHAFARRVSALRLSGHSGTSPPAIIRPAVDERSVMDGSRHRRQPWWKSRRAA